MPEITWTTDQRNAIEAKDTNLIVAAAAGSGKTSVLIERLARLLTDPDEHLDLERDLIAITFTKSAAENLKEKLAERLMNLQAKDPSDRRFEHLLATLPRANISTVDSLCYRLVVENAALLDLPPKLQIIDETVRAASLRRCFDLALEELLDETRSEPAAVEDLKLLHKLVNTGKSDADLEKLVISAYEKLRVYPEGLSKLEELVFSDADRLAELDEDHFNLLETPLGADVRTLFSEKLSRIRARLEASVFEFPEHLVTPDVFPALFHFIDRIDRFADALNNADSDLLCEIALEGNGPPNRLGTAGLDEIDQEILQEGKPFYKKIYDDAKLLWKDIIDLFRTPFSPYEEECQRVKLERAFVRLLQKTSDYYEAQKRASGLMDFSDLEHLAHRALLLQRDRQFCRYLFVDEYQDTNRLQDEIFALLSAHGKFFYVGDVKQSIYGFRGAVPSLFLGYKNSFPLYDPQNAADKQCILLSDNFRSDSGVIDFVNETFRVLMGSQQGMYDQGDELRHASIREDAGIKPELVILNKPSVGEKREMSDEEQEEIENQDACAYLIFRIRQLIAAGEQPDEIAVLAYTNQFLKELKARMEEVNLPCDFVSPESFINSAEYLYCRALLTCLENPVSEIPLVAVLTGPLFCFSSDDLIAIRAFSENATLFDALTLYAKHSAPDALQEKARAFLEFWTAWRDKSRGVLLSDFLLRLIRETELGALFAENEDEKTIREEHLLFLYELARGFESNSIRTLSEFVAYLNDLSPESIRYDERKTGKRPIRLMTIHNAKGLEFKTCFVAELNKMATSKEAFLFDPEHGLIGEYYCEEEDRKYDTLSRKLLAFTQNASEKLEDLRTLYVALTRAVERLILVAVPRSLKTTLSRSGLDPYLPSGSMVSDLDCKAPLESILFALRNNDDLRNAFEHYLSDPSEQVLNCDCGAFSCSILHTLFLEAPDAETEKKETAPRFDEQDAQKVEELLDSLRIMRDQTILPSKVSVSELAHLSAKSETPRSYRLSFTETTRSAAQIGLAMHAFMQFCDFENARQSPENEASRLVDLEFLSPEDAKRLNFFALDRFFESATYERIKKSPLVKRELRFNVFLDARILFGTGEGKTLLQGVIDCYFENPDHTITIIDFKTDALDPKTGEEVLLARHAKQLNLYRRAVEEITQKRVSELSLYSFSLGREIRVPMEAD